MAKGTRVTYIFSIPTKNSYTLIATVLRSKIIRMINMLDVLFGIEISKFSRPFKGRMISTFVNTCAN